jgi:hypothetical protein
MRVFYFNSHSLLRYSPSRSFAPRAFKCFSTEERKNCFSPQDRKVLRSIKTKIDTMVKLQRIDFATDQINLELQDRLYTGWQYSGRDAREIRRILFAFRQDYGQWIPNHVATEAYRTSLQSEIHQLLGVKPRLELDENDDGDDQWVIWYS